jgi:hypothetical protein
VQAQEQQDQQGEKPFKFHQDQDLYEFNRDLREKYSHIERGIEQNIEQVLGQEQQTFADLLQAVEAEHVIARCDLQAMNALLQKLFDLEGRLATLRETIANSFYNIDLALDAIEDDAVVRAMIRLCERGAAQRVFEAPGLLDESVRSMVERERNHLLYLKSRVEELLGQQRDFEEAVRTKLRDLIGEFLRRCCGKERCGDTSRPTTGSSGHPPDASPPRDSGMPPPPGNAGGAHLLPAPPQDHGTPSKDDDWSFLPGYQRPGALAQPTPPQTPETGQSLGEGGMPQPPETGARPPTGTPTTGLPPQTGSGVPLTQATFCCESCPGNDRTRFYFPIPPDTNCQPGDVRREDLPYPQCPGNLFTEEPGPPTYGPACCAGKQDQVLYDSAKSGGVSSEVGSALRAACDNDPCAGKVEAKPGAPMRLETSVLSSGTDVQGRNWVPENPVLRVGKERLKPCHAEPFYATKEATTNAAAVVLSAISTDYADDAKAAETSKGSSCHASEGGKEVKRDSPQERAAKAAAIGLLTSQAKGQIEGLRATFDVTGREEQLGNAKLQADVVNEVTQRKTSLSLPVRFDTSER